MLAQLVARVSNCKTANTAVEFFHHAEPATINGGVMHGKGKIHVFAPMRPGLGLSDQRAIGPVEQGNGNAFR